MTEIVDLNKRRAERGERYGDTEPAEELVLICSECGSKTFYVVSSGELECTLCATRMDDDISGVRYDDIVEVPRPETIRSKHVYETDELAYRAVLKHASLEASAAVVIINKDGRTHVWSTGAEDEEQEEWFKARVDNLMEQLI